jgi:hypothetical protein
MWKRIWNMLMLNNSLKVSWKLKDEREGEAREGVEKDMIEIEAVRKWGRNENEKRGLRVCSSFL